MTRFSPRTTYRLLHSEAAVDEHFPEGADLMGLGAIDVCNFDAS